MSTIFPDQLKISISNIDYLNFVIAVFNNKKMALENRR